MFQKRTLLGCPTSGQTVWFSDIYCSFIFCLLQEGMVYAVEFSHRSGRDLINMAKKRTNVVPIIEDARHPHKYRMLVPMVDTIFADVAQPDQVYYLKSLTLFHNVWLDSQISHVE